MKEVFTSLLAENSAIKHIITQLDTLDAENKIMKNELR